MSPKPTTKNTRPEHPELAYPLEDIHEEYARLIAITTQIFVDAFDALGRALSERDSPYAKDLAKLKKSLTFADAELLRTKWATLPISEIARKMECSARHAQEMAQQMGLPPKPMEEEPAATEAPPSADEEAQAIPTGWDVLEVARSRGDIIAPLGTKFERFTLNYSEEITRTRLLEMANKIRIQNNKTPWLQITWGESEYIDLPVGRGRKARKGGAYRW